LVIAATALTSIAAGSAGAKAGSDRVEVVAAFYPLAWAAEQVGGDNVDVTNLTPAGAEPHDLELTPDQRDAIEDARLVVVLGKGFQPAVEDAASDRDSGTLRVLARLPIETKGKRVAEEDEEGEPGALDPHVWLDPVLMSEVVDDVTTALVKEDKKHAVEYRANAVELKTELAALDGEFSAGLANCERDLVVTAHEAFGYLAGRYGLTQEGVAGVAPDAEPSAARIAELADVVEREGVTTIFTEELVSPRIAETLAREAGGLQTAVLNPLEGLTDDQVDDGADYLSEMRGNLDELEAALGCTPA
jgi:zinc transport system substrate-binding protein